MFGLKTKMDKLIVCLFCVAYYPFVYGSDIYHEHSKIVFQPESYYENGYFGYTVLLYRYGILIGAPKSRSKDNPAISPGNVFNCSFTELDKPSVTCLPMGSNDTDYIRNKIRRILNNDFIKDDMWFGASIAPISDGKVLLCAPRWALPYKDLHLLAIGACYLRKKDRDSLAFPLRELSRQIYTTDGKRKEYGEYGSRLNFYAYGQAGFSIKVTTNNTLIIGAPGLLQWSGGVVNFNFNPDEDSSLISRQPVTNPYFTKELGPDDYFGYSVESGTFEKHGLVLYVAGAPRSKRGYGQVFVFKPARREQESLNIQAIIKGPQLGAYFGASLCCMDIDGDGRSDLLVGAPTYINVGADLPYDQGAVFVFMSKEKDDGFILKESGFVSGSGKSGAKFGTAIAELGDVDGDGFIDVAIGAPWEDGGTGVVYIYRGSIKGLHKEPVQRIFAQESSGFGISISKGYDVDHNNCNDLAIGAYGNGRAYLYRCIPTVQVYASIKVPDAMSLPQNATGFTALFCIRVPVKPLWNQVKLDLKAKITIDPNENRAQVSGDSEYNVTVRPGNDICAEQNVEVRPTADLSKPILIKFELEPIDTLQNDSKPFAMDAARLSDDSELHSSFLIQLVRDCGDDLICTPWLVMTLESLNNPYIPGTDMKFGAIVTVVNKEEPAYGARVNITLPAIPVRVPGDCSLQELNMTCIVPAPLLRDEEVVWEIELEYAFKETYEVSLKIVAVLEDLLYNRNITNDTIKELVIEVTPEANFTVSGKSLPNATIPITREKLNENDNVSFIHYFELTNMGPSDWYNLDADIILPEKVNLSKSLKGCVELDSNITCSWPMPSKVSKPVMLQLRFDLNEHGEFLKENPKLNVTTKIMLKTKNQLVWTEITTTLVLDPAPPIWPLIVGIIAGLLVLTIIIYVLYKYGFFSRAQREKLKELKEQNTQEQSTSSSSAELHDPNESTHELISEDSD